MIPPRRRAKRTGWVGCVVPSQRPRLQVLFFHTSHPVRIPIPFPAGSTRHPHPGRHPYPTCSELDSKPTPLPFTKQQPTLTSLRALSIARECAWAGESPLTLDCLEVHVPIAGLESWADRMSQESESQGVTQCRTGEGAMKVEVELKW
jgi:hypothetical protein